MQQINQPVTVFWFRRDLRLNDNHGLYKALKNSDTVLPVFIFDTLILDKLPGKKDKRVAYIYETLQKLNTVLKENSSSLLIIHDSPKNAFEKILKNFDVKEVYTNHDYEPYAIERDALIENLLSGKNIPFYTFKDQVIFEKSEVIKPNGEPYTIFTPYLKTWKQKFNAEKINIFPCEKYLSHFVKIKAFTFPSLKEIAFDKVDPGIPDLHIDKDTITHYDERRNLPSIDGTSHASVYLRFGTVSVRRLVTIANNFNEKWLNELIWREFFMMILFQFPYVVNNNFNKKYDHIKWRNNEKEFDLWCKGETGYPIVDAGMRQLNETGTMHNRVRMIVASFLTKHLLIDWRWGEAYFAEKLLDYELSSNNGNWQWAAGTGCDAAPYFRIFNPSEQIKKFDPKLLYIKKWIKNFRPGYLPEIVEHKFARLRALDAYKKALEQH